MTLYGFFYRVIQRLMHRFNLHYMHPLYPDGEKQIWCTWCGARYSDPMYKRRKQADIGTPYGTVPNIPQIPTMPKCKETT